MASEEVASRQSGMETLSSSSPPPPSPLPQSRDAPATKRPSTAVTDTDVMEAVKTLTEVGWFYVTIDTSAGMYRGLGLYHLP